MDPVRITVEQIDAIFEEAEHQSDYMIALYRLIYDEIWDDLDHVIGWPKVGKRTATYMIGKCMTFDKKHHPDVMAGGLWLNNGFSREVGLDEWTIYPAKVVMLVVADE